MKFSENVANINGKIAETVKNAHASYQKSKMRGLQKEIANLEEKTNVFRAKILVFEGKIKPLDVKIAQAQAKLKKLEEYYEI